MSSFQYSNFAWSLTSSGEGGRVIDLVMKYAGTDVSGALAWMNDLFGGIIQPKKASRSAGSYEQNTPSYEVIKSKAIDNRNLIDYLQERRIRFDLARKYLKEVRYKDTKSDKKYNGLSLENRAVGYAMRQVHEECHRADGYYDYRGQSKR